MAASERRPLTECGSGKRKRRKAVLAATAGVLALGGAAVVVPAAFAEDPAAREGVVEILPVDDSLLGLIDVGEVEEVTESLTYAGEQDAVTVSEPDAGYVKVHFERLLLDAGDHVTVSSPDGTESYRYEQSMVDQWATSITGDTAVVELHRAESSPASDALGVLIDRVAYGFADDEVDAMVEDKADQTRREESICSGDEKRSSACYRHSHPDVVERADPVARLLIDGTVLCTAFRVGEDNRLLTNHHCFTESWEAKQTEVWFGYGCLACGTEAASIPLKVNGDEVLKTSKALDYTLFTVDDFARIEHFGHLDLADRPAEAGEAIYIPQHPAGRPTEIALESKQDGGNCVVKDAVYDGYVPGSDVSYYCDTEFGSSGSPVISRGSHEVVALHHFGGCPNSGVNAHLIRNEISRLI
jgi:hypothetical protein